MDIEKRHGVVNVMVAQATIAKENENAQPARLLTHTQKIAARSLALGLGVLETYNGQYGPEGQVPSSLAGQLVHATTEAELFRVLETLAMVLNGIGEVRGTALCADLGVACEQLQEALTESVPAARLELLVQVTTFGVRLVSDTAYPGREARKLLNVSLS